jgi:hypothetical protein
MTATAHLVLYHKHPTSARLRFLRHAHGGICADGVMPADTRIEPGNGAGGAVLHTHPGMLLRAAEAALALPRGCIEPDGDFRCRVVVGEQPSEVHLAHFSDVDPPLAAAAAAGGEFLELAAARRLPAPELQLMRLAYEHVLG